MCEAASRNRQGSGAEPAPDLLRLGRGARTPATRPKCARRSSRNSWARRHRRRRVCARWAGLVAAVNGPWEGRGLESPRAFVSAW